MVVKELGHDGKSDAWPSSVHNARDFFVLKANNVLPIDFQQIVIREEAVTSCRWIFNETANTAVLESKADMPKAIFV